MKRILLIAAFAALAVRPGLAADMAIKAAPAPTAVAAFDWGGFYIGGDAGWQGSRIDLSNPDPGFTLSYGPHHDSFALGAFIGAQHQFGQFVLGVEGGYLSGFGRASLGAVPAVSIFSPGVTGTAHAKLKDIWSGGARLGWAMGNWMPYLTGGYANGAFEFDAQNPPQAVALAESEQVKASTGGGYIGGGLDWALPNQPTSAWIFGVEYRHYAFNAKTVTGVIVPANSTESVRFGPRTDTVVARLSYKFNWPMK